MAGGKETPRQKMIGMMYLVLTALLALNVSKDILDAFAVIDKGIKKTTDSFSDKVEGQMAAFENSYQENKEKVEKYYNKAKTVEKDANELINYINIMKAKVISSSLEATPDNYENYIAKNQETGRDTVLGIDPIEKKDDYDSPGYFLLGEDPAKPKDEEHSALALQKKMEAFRDQMISFVQDNPAKVERLKEDFKFEDGTDKSGVKMGWPSLTFYHQTVAATLTMLSKLQADVRTVESDMISHLYSEVDAASYKFNKLVPVVNVKESFLAPGDSFKADIYLAAIDTTKDPVMNVGSTYDEANSTVGGKPLPVEVKKGVGFIRFKTKDVGEKEWKGVIDYKTPTGEMNHYPFEFSYKVSDAGAVISPTKMNVLYRGIENPVSVSVPGVDPDNIELAASSAGFKIKPDPSAPGSYLITPGKQAKGREVSLLVNAKSENKKKKVGEKPFRLKPLPPPTPLFMGKKPTDDVIQLVALKSGDKLFCVLEDFLFDGIKFEVTKFSLSTTRGGDLISYNTRGDRLSGEMKSAIGQMRKNQIITFNNIYAVGPDGVEQKLASLSFKII